MRNKSGKFNAFLILALLALISCGCLFLRKDSVDINIYNVDDSLVSARYVCSDSNHYYYYYDNKMIYDDEGRVICNAENLKDVYLHSWVASDDVYLYYYDNGSKKLLRTNIETLDEEEIETDIDLIDICGYHEGVFVEYLKDDTRYLKYYSYDDEVSIYDEIRSNNLKLTRLKNSSNLYWYYFGFYNYKIVIYNDSNEEFYSLYVVDNNGKQYSMAHTFCIINDDVYNFVNCESYEVDSESYRYDIGIDLPEWGSLPEPNNESVKDNKIYFIENFTKRQHGGGIESQILAAFDTETKTGEIIYQTFADESEYIVNFSVDDNRIYTMKDGIVYMKPLDDVNSDGQEICDLTGYMELGFDYADGHLFIYNDANADLIGIY